MNGVRRISVLAARACLASLALLSAPLRSGAVCNQPLLFSPATSQTAGARSSRPVLVDLNHDGILDLAVATPDTPGGSFATTIAVLIGNGSGGVGNGTFAAPTSIPVGTRPWGVVSGNFDGDGNVDLAVSNWSSNNVSILHGNGDGTFGSAVNFAAGPGPDEIRSADLNHDGIPDLVVANNKVASVSVLIGQGSGGVPNGTFAAPVSYATGDLSLGVTIGDLDGDGNLDLVATAYQSHKVDVFMGIADGTFQTARHVTATGTPYASLIADLDGDGIPDLIVGDGSFGGIGVLKGTGGGFFGAPTLYSSGVSSGGLALTDLNGDGIPDLVCDAAQANNVLVLLGQGSGGVGDGTFAPHSTYPVAGFPLGLACADINGDGTKDVVVACYDGLGVSILLAGCITPPPPPPPLGPPHLVSVKDVPHDQGGFVFLRWTKSAFDTARSATPITGYRIWRRLPPGAPVTSATRARGTHLRPAGGAGHDAIRIEYWEAIATVPAERLAGYGYTAHTTQDSMAGSNPLTAFFVTALTYDDDVFYESNPDSGYSVDNLSPPTPAPFVGEFGPSANALHWGPSRAADLLEFRLFRGATFDFAPGPTNQIAATRDTGYVDHAGFYYYKLVAVDVHGNLSHVALVSPTGPTASLASLVSVRPQPDRIAITWYAAGNAGVAARVERRTETSPWLEIAQIVADGAGFLRFEDADVALGTRYGYRLMIADGDGEVAAGEVWATPEPLRFVLDGVRPNPAVGRAMSVSFALPSSAPAQLDLFDVSGRRVLHQEVGTLGPGPHQIDLARIARIPSGVYLIRLHQGQNQATARAVLLE